MKYIKSETILTVVIISYNNELLISKTLESVLNQETKYKYKINIYDDNSTDNTLAISEKFRSKYPALINIIKQNKNLGALPHVKIALNSINTKYFVILEADDYWTSKLIMQDSLSKMESNNRISMCASNTLIKYYKNNKYISKEKIVGNNFSNGIKNNGDKVFFFADAPYLHTSTRFCRNYDIDLLAEPKEIILDIFFFYKYLTLGNLYYQNKTASVYTSTGNGHYSSYNKTTRQLRNLHMKLIMDGYFNTSIFFKKQNHVMPKFIIKWFRFILAKILSFLFDILMVRLPKTGKIIINVIGFIVLITCYLMVYINYIKKLSIKNIPNKLIKYVRRL